MNYDLKNDEIEQNYTNEAMSDKQAWDQRVFLSVLCLALYVT